MIKNLLNIPILKRLVPSIIKKLNINHFNFTYNNLQYQLDLRYLVDRRFFLHGWDDDVIEYINAFCKLRDCKYFLDVGSCWGIYSLQIAKNNPDIQIYAFDVFNKNIARLNKMSKLNNIKNIITFNYAVGSEEKMAVFSVNEEFSPNFSKDLNGQFKINVKQNLIDNLVDISEANIVIKMDIERTELDALKVVESYFKKITAY